MEMPNAWIRRGRVFAAGAIALALVAACVYAPVEGEGAGGPVASKSGRTVIKSKTFRMTGADEKRRMTVRCPGGKSPYGGGMTGSPPPGPDGEGVYPHSYERLGVQGGWHVTPVLYDPSHRSTQARRVTLEVVCGRKLGHVTPPHVTRYVRPGQTKKLVATCPGRRRLMGGGFQRTDFVSRGGNYATEAHMISPKKWKVVATAFGGFGGEITAIGYCLRSKKPLLREVSASTTIAPRTVGSVTTRGCPGKRRLVFGGFDSSPVGSLFIADGTFNGGKGWTQSAYNHSGAAATLTAYGYCLKL
jgi:hypothetical protein